MGLIRPQFVERIHSEGEYLDRLDEYSALGYKTKPYRDGTLVYKAYYGHWFWHIILFLFTRGIGNVIYALLSMRGRKTRAAYVKPTFVN